jgi:hypothetical protein
MSIQTDNSAGMAQPQQAALRNPNAHFTIAVLVLVAAAGWWLFAKNVLKLALTKEAVPWPAVVAVDEGFRMTSLPSTLGIYTSQKDMEFPEDDRKLLGIGSAYDVMRRPVRSSNWYVSRIYVASNSGQDVSSLDAWQLDITYYTGGLDTVPHIPEVCMVQGGSTLLGSDKVLFNLPNVESPWNSNGPFQRAQYEVANNIGIRNHYCQYYVFSLNGKPENDWKKVRAELALPWKKYCYFAKIQFVPLRAVSDVEQCDRDAEKFMTEVLPKVLEQLPRESDVQVLESIKR